MHPRRVGVDVLSSPLLDAPPLRRRGDDERHDRATRRGKSVEERLHLVAGEPALDGFVLWAERQREDRRRVAEPDAVPPRELQGDTEGGEFLLDRALCCALFAPLFDALIDAAGGEVHEGKRAVVALRVGLQHAHPVAGLARVEITGLLAATASLDLGSDVLDQELEGVAHRRFLPGCVGRIGGFTLPLAGADLRGPAVCAVGRAFDALPGAVVVRAVPGVAALEELHPKTSET
ncbi:MAG: hypothetical protein U0326_35035 [Polyangiales bacterium]